MPPPVAARCGSCATSPTPAGAITAVAAELGVPASVTAAEMYRTATVEPG
ncbi:hypothetical protein ACFY0P_07230 [Streptomyces sp. NPDC001714]